MADTVTTQTLFQGDKVLVMKFTNVSDGTGETNVVKVNVSSLNSYQGSPCVAVQVDRVYAMTAGMEVRLNWEATTPQLIMAVPTGVMNTQDYDDFGGIDNNAGTGKTGNITFTTVGASLGDSYTIILKMRKLY
jgi:hypothetical protein